MTSPADGSGARLTVSAVARRLGVAPATLRTWDRRYGVGPSDHVDGAHRRYTSADLARLEVMRRLVLEGAPASEAARVALTTAYDAPEGAPLALPPHPPGPADPDAVVRGLLRAATALDSAAVAETAIDHLGRLGVQTAWEAVLLPALVAVGARWAATGQGVEVEHLLSDGVSSALRRHAARHHATSPPRPVLLASAPGDLHDLPLHALAAGLAERGIAGRVLGAAVPADALHAAVRRTGPSAVFLWSGTPPTADPEPLRGLPRTRPPAVVVAGGPGWDAGALPPGVHRAADLGAAVDLMASGLPGGAVGSAG